MQKTVTVPFMLLGILFNICLVASNLLETKVVQVGGITATAGLIVFPISYIINDCIAEVWGFNFVFGMAPRIAVASLIAVLAGSFLNAYVMSKMKIASNGKNFSLRAIVSTLIGESADSLIFFPIAFAGLIPAGELLIMIGTQAVLKSLYEVIILPVTIRVVKYIK